MVRAVRIVSGLVLFTYVAMHLVNVAFGLSSIEAMDAARPYFMGLWTNPLGSLVLMAAFLAHFSLGLAAIYQRNTLRMSRTDAVQILASLLVVPLLTPHVVGTALAARYGIAPSFASLIPYFWIWAPEEGLRQVLLLAFLWIHGCVGVFTWARVQPWWSRAGAFLHPFAVAIPVLALLGFVSAGNEAIRALDAEPAIAADTASQADAYAMDEGETEYAAPAGEQRSRGEILAILSRVNWTVFSLYLVVVSAVLVARRVRLAGDRNTVRIAFAEGPDVTAPAGLSVLEIAEQRNVAIAHLCRGRARCGTCRVRLAGGDATLPHPTHEEAQTLARVGAAPGERLACQLRPGPGTLVVERVLAPYVRPGDLHRTHPAPLPAPAEGNAA
ncbi:(2Fe-2S)-binding protein [Aquibium carbonis]|uniref:(2Fe-2S)-binding protein n=1 Tax=Aquibium carbonis TaxID=2495581 RepID=A0A3S0AU37_9HYPH|nr:2Fe-2S iron-sulfur cluster-binding protein [Aquibium carbonis]RST87129.1 (2Fe-2S)-binding protein [Aquibium carbonis]